MSSERKPPDDRELEDFLAGLHPVGKAYREASKGQGAPPELDAAILGAAREAVQTRRAVTRRPRWVQPVAVAATLALSLGILMNLWRDPVTREQMAPTAADVDLQRAKEDSLKEGADAALPARKAEQASAAAGALRDAAPPAELGAAAGAMLDGEVDAKANYSRSFRRPIDEEQKKSKAFSRPDGGPPGAAAGVAQAEPPKPAPRREAPKSAAESRPEPAARSSTGFVPEPPLPVQSAPAAAPPPPPASAPNPQTAAPPPSNSAAQDSAAGAAGPGYEWSLQVAPEKPEKPEKPAKDERQQSSEKLDAMAKQRSRRDADRATAGSSLGSVAAPSAPASKAAPATTPANKAVEQESRERDSADDSLSTAPPDVWIRRIRDLRERGDEKSAGDLLNRFRSQYPDYVLPEDLRILLEQR
jgi:hypothetical protein